MRVDYVRGLARDFADEYSGGLGDLAKATLRILDAFDAMDKHSWRFARFTRLSDCTKYWVVLRGAEVIADGEKPLAALLAAAEMEKRDD